MATNRATTRRVTIGLRTLLSVLLGLSLTLPGAAASAAGKTAKGKPSTAKKTTKKRKTRAKKGARSGKTKTPPTLPQAIAGVRAHLAAAGKANKPSDLATLMIGGLIELGFVQAIHGHYALAGVGQSHRSGAMAGPATQLAARDMARNFDRLALAYEGLAAQKEFRGQLATLYGDLAKLLRKAQLAAAALTHWSDARGDTARAKAFEAAVENYRKGVAAFAKQTRGG